MYLNRLLHKKLTYLPTNLRNATIHSILSTIHILKNAPVTITKTTNFKTFKTTTLRLQL